MGAAGLARFREAFSIEASAEAIAEIYNDLTKPVAN
jgi:glycosyltransferase involved in cell wall biosynthesis